MGSLELEGHQGTKYRRHTDTRVLHILRDFSYSNISSEVKTFKGLGPLPQNSELSSHFWAQGPAELWALCASVSGFPLGIPLGLWSEESAWDRVCPESPGQAFESLPRSWKQLSLCGKLGFLVGFCAATTEPFISFGCQELSFRNWGPNRVTVLLAFRKKQWRTLLIGWLIDCVCLACFHVPTCAVVHIWRTEDNLWQSLPSSHHVFLWWHSGSQAWWKDPLPAELSGQLLGRLFKICFIRV